MGREVRSGGGNRPGAPPVNARASGRLNVTITHLEMRSRPRLTLPHPGAKLAFLRAEEPTASFYRYLYNGVGENWLWTDRRVLDDERLLAAIRDPNVAIYVLHVAGVPAGYAELARLNGGVELSYFGLMPEFIGRRLGPWFLEASVDLAWSGNPETLFVQTCTLDHPKALALYQRAGFVPVRQEKVTRADPRLSGIVPMTAAPHVPIGGA